MGFRLLCIVVILFTASLAIAQAAGNQPNIGDAAYSLGLVWLNEKVSGIAGALPFNFAKVAAEHGPDAPFLEGPFGANWADPFWDDAGWAISKDWANTGAALHGVPGASFFFNGISFLLITAEQNNQQLIEWQDKLGVTDFWLSVLPHDPLVESSSSGLIAALAVQGLGTPLLSPPDSDMSWVSHQGPTAGYGPLMPSATPPSSQSPKRDLGKVIGMWFLGFTPTGESDGRVTGEYGIVIDIGGSSQSIWPFSDKRYILPDGTIILLSDSEYRSILEGVRNPYTSGDGASYNPLLLEDGTTIIPDKKGNYILPDGTIYDIPWNLGG